MKVMFQGTDDNLQTTSSVFDVCAIDNGVTEIYLEGLDEDIKVPNALRFSLVNKEEVFILVSVNTGEQIVRDAFEKDKLDLSSHKDRTFFYPYDEEDKQEILKCINNFSFW